jgi:hypothetical protein
MKIFFFLQEKVALSFRKIPEGSVIEEGDVRAQCIGIFFDYAPGLAYKAYVGRLKRRNAVGAIRYCRNLSPTDPVPVSGG